MDCRYPGGNQNEPEWTRRDRRRQIGVAYPDSRDHEESDTTERLIDNNSQKEIQDHASEEAPLPSSFNKPNSEATTHAAEGKDCFGNDEDTMFGRRTVVPWLTDRGESRPLESGKRCHLCGSSSPAFCCERCSNLIFCSSCDDMYHRHPKRRDHVRKVVSVAPPPPPPRPPPKITDPNKIPVPPPRRRKSHKSISGSPIFGRKQVEQKPELPKKQFPLKFGSLKRFIPGNSSNKPAATSGPGKEFPQQSPEIRLTSEVAGASPSSPSGPFRYPVAPQGTLMNESGRRMDARFIEGRYGCNVSQSDNQPVRRRTSGYLDTAGYYDGRSNAVEPSSSDAEEDRGSGACSIGRGSGSFVGSDEWPRTMGTLPPPYGGMTSRSMASLDQVQGYPPQPYLNYSTTLTRRNTMMSGTLERNVPYGYHPRPSGAMQHSTSVCDLSNQMMPSPVVGYPLPQVHSLASLPQNDMEAGIPLTAPCGCRPNWVGPDAFGQWHPPARCLAHSSASNVYLKQQHPPPLSAAYPPEGVFHPRLQPTMYPTVMLPTHAYPQSSPTPPPPPRPATQTSGSGSHDARATPLERPHSPAASARSTGSRRKVKAGGGRSRGQRSHHRRSRPEFGSSSEEDYFSAGESDEEPVEDDRRSSRVAVRVRSHRPADGSWECEHCTFINSATTRICAVCCKTTGRAGVEKRSDGTLDSGNQERPSSDARSRASPSPARQSRINSHSTRSSRSQPKDEGVYEDLENGGQVNHRSAAANDKLLSKQMKEALQLNSDPEASTLGEATLGNGTQPEARLPAGPNKLVPVQESRSVQRMDAALDPMEDGMVGSVQADTQTYATVFKEKILPPTSSATAAAKFHGSPKSVTSTGTSPPPQSIATQTPVHEAWTSHDPPLLPKASSVSRSSSRLSLTGDSVDPGGMMYRPAPSALKRAASLHFTGSGPSDNPWGGHYWHRSGSRASLSYDHQFGYPSGPPSRDVSPPRNFASRRDSNLERGYATLAALVNHQEYGKDRSYGPRSVSRNYLSLEELVEKRRQETLRTQGLELVRLLREAEQHNFTADDLQVALNHCGSQNPIQWLHDNWKNMVDTVVTLATNYGHDKKENDIGIVSSNEAKDCLRLHKGNIWAAVTECVEQRQKKFTELQRHGNYSREEVVAALAAHQGNVEAALNELNKASLKPFLMRIWGPPAGVDNEAGATWPRQHQSSKTREDSPLAWPQKEQRSHVEPSFEGRNGWLPKDSDWFVPPRDFEMSESPGGNRVIPSKAESSDLEDYLGIEDVEGFGGSFDEPEDVRDLCHAEQLDTLDIRDDVFYDAVPDSPSTDPDELANSADFHPVGVQASAAISAASPTSPDMPAFTGREGTSEQLSLSLSFPPEPPESSLAAYVPAVQQLSTSTTSVVKDPFRASPQRQETTTVEIGNVLQEPTVQLPQSTNLVQPQTVTAFPSGMSGPDMTPSTMKPELPVPLQHSAALSAQPTKVIPQYEIQTNPTIPKTEINQQLTNHSEMRAVECAGPLEVVGEVHSFGHQTNTKNNLDLVESNPGESNELRLSETSMVVVESVHDVQAMELEEVAEDIVNDVTDAVLLSSECRPLESLIAVQSSEMVVDDQGTINPTISEVLVSRESRPLETSSVVTKDDHYTQFEGQEVSGQSTVNPVASEVIVSSETRLSENLAVQADIQCVVQENNPQRNQKTKVNSVSASGQMKPMKSSLTSKGVHGVPSVMQDDKFANSVNRMHNVVVSKESEPVRDPAVHSVTSQEATISIREDSPPHLPESETGKVKKSTVRSAVKAKSDNLDFSRRVRRLLAEERLPSYERAEVAVQLIELKFDESEAIHAALECSDIYMAISFLQQECELCTGKFPMGKMISMLHCTHRCCQLCAKNYFTIKIKERNIMEAVCPFCNEPNLSDDDVAVDYFNHLDILLKNLVDEDIHELFQRKLRDRALMSDPNFHWCYKCSSGFIAEPNRRRLVCPDCKVVTCAQCKKPWEKQHDGISCEKFSEWKQSNDPEFQLAGLEKYLAENGIDCPKCKFKYALAKGGCMHFICSQCKFEFCSGCGRPFKMAKKCGVSERCEKLGLHAHHPRNCLFYLRDKEPQDLQKLLEDNQVQYNTEVSTDDDRSALRRCPVVEQKELPDGNEDAMCGREVEDGHSGLCRLHYVEYLVSLVNSNALDPVTIMDTGGLQQQLKRKERLVPEQKDGETDEDYRNKLIQMILKEIPLEDE